MPGYPDPDHGIPWRAFFPHEGKVGSVIGDKIAVDSGVFNPDLLTTKYGRQIGEQWENTRLRDRLDAVTAHEYAEAGGLDHKEAVQRAADTPLAIREKARQMLRIIADAENRGTGR